MKLSLFVFLLPVVSSFSTTKNTVHSTNTQLEATRRQALEFFAGAACLYPTTAHAFSQQLDDFAYEPQQQATDGKLDLNAAFVGEYKTLRGMFPTAAGKIASHGPYKKVKDIYKIPGLTDHDVAMFKKYENEFSVHMPGRSFYERINARVST